LFYLHIKNYGKYRMTTPTIVSQYAEDSSHIEWNNNITDLKYSAGVIGVSTVKPLLHISRQPRNDITMQTWYIKATGFNFTNLPQQISGITVTIAMERHGRVTDDTVQLCYQDEPIGENLAFLTWDPTTVYGGVTNTWKVKNLSAAMVQDSSFGLLLRYQSHPRWPHSTVPIIRSIDMQVS